MPGVVQAWVLAGLGRVVRDRLVHVPTRAVGVVMRGLGWWVSPGVAVWRVDWARGRKARVGTGLGHHLCLPSCQLFSSVLLGVREEILRPFGLGALFWASWVAQVVCGMI